ncbi:hypothetical protein Q9L58_009118 [Maublancomyces gigas]|uniref:Fumarylacetoacetase n=1 Tax=Discina gigas TaxID=1032678 RepID=A0ABR3G7U9_9PEZI
MSFDTLLTRSESWLPVSPDSHFGLDNIPFGIISTRSDRTPRPAVAIGAKALDLAVFAANGGFSSLPQFTETTVFTTETSLNAFAALGRKKHTAVRYYLQEVLEINTQYPQKLKTNVALQSICLHDLTDVRMHLPLQIGNYTDFYAGKNHAYNVGVLFRGPENALQPNYEHMPIGYHGRASSVVVSGTTIRRPRGQILEDPKAAVRKSIFTATKQLDYELELAVFVARNTKIGESVDVNEAAEFLFGVVLMNDWSARDIQGWEYVPLGPFTSKSFATSISPWVVLIEALEPFRAIPLPRTTDIPLHPYLQEREQYNVYNIDLSISLSTPCGATHTLSKTSSSNLLYSFPQLLAHHSITGCPLRTGDLLGTGTISGTDAESLGSLLEVTKNGTSSLVLQDDGERVFLEDGDEVIMEGYCGRGVGFGSVSGLVLPAWTDTDTGRVAKVS